MFPRSFFPSFAGLNPVRAFEPLLTYCASPIAQGAVFHGFFPGGLPLKVFLAPFVSARATPGLPVFSQFIFSLAVFQPLLRMLSLPYMDVYPSAKLFLLGHISSCYRGASPVERLIYGRYFLVVTYLCPARLVVLFSPRWPKSGSSRLSMAFPTENWIVPFFFPPQRSAMLYEQYSSLSLQCSPPLHVLSPLIFSATWFFPPGVGPWSAVLTPPAE